MKSLQLPPTIKLCTSEDVPEKDVDIINLKYIEQLKIVQGYTLVYNDSTEFPYKFYSEININNDKLWVLFKSLLLLLPDEIACIYHHRDDEPTYGIYDDKYKILNELEKYEVEITQDGFLEMGVIYNDNEHLEEIFIKRAKYIQYWGVDQTHFEKIMNEFQLNEITGLKFVDEFPMMTTWIKEYNPDALETLELLKELDKVFKEC